jgi:hypothetical protein
MPQEERSIFWGFIVSVYMYVCHIPNGFRGRAMSSKQTRQAISIETAVPALDPEDGGSKFL